MCVFFYSPDSILCERKMTSEFTGSMNGKSVDYTYTSKRQRNINKARAARWCNATAAVRRILRVYCKPSHGSLVMSFSSRCCYRRWSHHQHAWQRVSPCRRYDFPRGWLPHSHRFPLGCFRLSSHPQLWLKTSGCLGQRMPHRVQRAASVVDDVDHQSARPSWECSLR